MLSKAMTRLFIITEIIFALTSIILTYTFTQMIGFEGVSIAHMVNYGVYWVVMSYFVFKALKEKVS